MDKPTENALAIIGTSKQAKPDQPLPLDAPAMDTSAEAVTIDLTAIETRMDPPKSETPKSETPAPDQSAPAAPAASGMHWQKYFPLAASVALALIVGALAGTAATIALSNDAPAAANTVLSDETRTLRERVVRLSGELAALKTGIEAANRTSSTQLTRIGERLDRAEKTQAEPAARLAKIAESLDRLERRTASAAPPPADVTGSVTSIEKQQAKPPAIEGWRLLDFYAGRVVLESRNGTLFEVGPGSTLPGVGKIETIKRIDGKVVITTPKGIITSSLEPPRRNYLTRGY
jgi:hypothetical protein